MTGRTAELAGLIACLAVAQPAAAGPPVTDADRAAAFPDVSGTPMHEHMHEDSLAGMLRADQFEWQHRPGGDALKWDFTGWLGYDMSRVWLRDEGEHVSGEAADNRVELLWGEPVSAWWDFVAGARADTGSGPTRGYAAIGLQGLAPQWFHVEVTAYLGEGGQVGLRLQCDYDWLLTNRAILSARAQGAAWSDDDERAGIGSGLSEVTAGLRLRYEFRRELAPYAGIEWTSLYGDTADRARAAGEEVRETRVVAGLRFWF